MRKEYTKCAEQLDKGRQFFQNILVPLAELPETWKYFGYKCFPNVENSQKFLDIGIKGEAKVKHEQY